MSDVNPSPAIEKKKRKRKKSEAKNAFTASICKNSLEDIQSFKNLLEQQNRSAKTTTNEHQKRAIIRLICNLGGRLCYVRDSLELIKTSGVQIDNELEGDIMDIIYHRNNFVHLYMYQDDEKQKEYFSNFLTLKRYEREGTISLEKIISFLIRLDKSSIEKLSNQKKKYVKQEIKEEEDKKETSENNLSRTISCLEVAMKESVYLEALKKESADLRTKIVINLDRSIKNNTDQKTIYLATENCIVNLCQAYLDFRKSLGKKSDPETNNKKDKIETNEAKSLIKTDAFGLLQNAFNKRKELAHLIELSNSEARDKFSVHIFHTYFEALLKNVRTLSLSPYSAH